MIRRDVFYLRGRLVRIVADLAGTAKHDAYFAALCDVAEFNRAHRDIAIPPAAKILRTTALAVCPDCIGEGSRLVGATIPLHGGVDEIECTCVGCGGSGFRGVRGYGENAIASGGHEVQSA